VERDRGGILVGIAVCLALVVAVGWPGTTNALLVAFATLLLTAGTMVVAWFVWEAAALAQMDDVRRALEAVRPLGERS